MNESLNSFEVNTGQDIIPEGTFEAELSDSQKSGIRKAISLGSELQTLIPDILVADFREGLSLDDIVDKNNLTSFAPHSVARNAVRLALCGYNKEVESLDDSTYEGLMDKEEYLALAESHSQRALKTMGKIGGKIGGKKQFEQGIGIHSQTDEERKEAGRMGAVAQGKRPYDPEEVDLVRKLSSQPEFQRLSRINAKKIAEELNIQLHGGETVRTPRQIQKMYYGSREN